MVVNDGVDALFWNAQGECKINVVSSDRIDERGGHLPALGCSMDAFRLTIAVASSLGPLKSRKCSCYALAMTLQRGATEVGVRELHDRLSEHLERVAAGQDVVVTRRGKPIAQLSAMDAENPLSELARRGLVTPPRRPRERRRPALRPREPVSDLVIEHRR